ncbi:hypothetical protein [Niastella populi]|uniref:Uncharacterized protein n=1 Tax=Niastella populi TaxID=550983 RepID=A0A1V9FDJ3_9BACT|nr:hypothetical protein [Niastella populi]OQP56438.1 hypothetical protein A4R26_04570 [Niastella populi]
MHEIFQAIAKAYRKIEKIRGNRKILREKLFPFGYSQHPSGNPESIQVTPFPFGNLQFPSENAAQNAIEVDKQSNYGITSRTSTNNKATTGPLY